MIELTKGNILQANVDALVNPVNCAGVIERAFAPLPNVRTLVYEPAEDRPLVQEMETRES